MIDKTIANEKWNEICFLLSENIKSEISEKDFENQVIRAIEILGWHEYKKEIERQHVLPIGRKGLLRPDIIIFDADKKALVAIEVKKPTEDITKTDTIDQLKSYMRQMKSDFGFLIGKEIRIYYDGHKNQQSEPLLLDKVGFERNSQLGKNFVENFNKEAFLANKFEDYLDRKINRYNRDREIKKLHGVIISEATKDKIFKFLEKEYADFGKEIFLKAMENVVVDIHTKDKFPSKSHAYDNSHRVRKERGKSNPVGSRDAFGFRIGSNKSKFASDISEKPLTMAEVKNLPWNKTGSTYYQTFNLLRKNRYAQKDNNKRMYIIGSPAEKIVKNEGANVVITGNNDLNDKLLKKVFVKVSGTEYQIEKYKSKTIRALNLATQQYETAKPILRQIIKEKKLTNNLYYSSGRIKNTRELGKQVIDALLNSGSKTSID